MAGADISIRVQASIVEENLRLRAALKYALNVIESYEASMRNSRQEMAGSPLESLPELSELGFCQGSIYKEAREDIKAIARGA